MFFIFSTPVLIRHLWQLKTVVFQHWCPICAVLFDDLKVFENDKWNLQNWVLKFKWIDLINFYDWILEEKFNWITFSYLFAHFVSYEDLIWKFGNLASPNKKSWIDFNFNLDLKINYLKVNGISLTDKRLLIETRGLYHKTYYGRNLWFL
jgi:hypothetical protein